MSFLYTTLTVPTSFLQILPDPTEVTVDQKYQNRSDLIVEDSYLNSSPIKKLILDEVNNKSSISLTVNETYNVLSENALRQLSNS